MRSRFWKLLKPKVTGDPERDSQVRNLFVILWGSLVLTVVFLIYALTSSQRIQIGISITVIVVEVILFLLLQNRWSKAIGTTFTGIVWLILVVEAYLHGGVREPVFALFIIPVVLAYLTSGLLSGFTFVFLTMVSGIAFIYLDGSGALPAHSPLPNSSALIIFSSSFLLTFLLIYQAINSYGSRLRKITASVDSVTKEKASIVDRQQDLQGRAANAERQNLIQRTMLEAIQVSTQSGNETGLLEKTVTWLAEKLKVDHIGVFITNRSEDSLILRASNSAEGKTLESSAYTISLEKSEFESAPLNKTTKHFPIGELNYYVTPPQQLDGIQSEISIPMVASDHLIGLINIQTKSADLNQLDEKLLQPFSDHLALLISQSRQIEELQEKLEEAADASARSLKSAWEQVNSGNILGYRYDQLQIINFKDPLPAQIKARLMSGKTANYVSAEKNPHARIVTPIILRGNVIGVIGYEQNDPKHEWLPEEITLLESIASRVSLALENTRLVADAQQRAERERLLGSMSARMRETLDIDTILQTAISDMRKNFGLKQSQVVLSIANPEVETSVGDKGVGK